MSSTRGTREDAALTRVDDTAGAALRWLRALMLATVALVTGVVAHVSADGLLPRAPVLLVVLLFTTAAVAPTLGRRASTARVVLLLVAGQSFIHVALAVSAGHRGDLTAPSHVERAEPNWLHHLVEDTVGDIWGPHALMAMAHLGAAVVVGLWLAAGERALWTLVTAATRPLATAFSTLVQANAWVVAAMAVTLLTRPRNVRNEVQPNPSRGWLLCRSVTRRGPPVPLGA